MECPTGHENARKRRRLGENYDGHSTRLLILRGPSSRESILTVVSKDMLDSHAVDSKLETTTRLGNDEDMADGRDIHEKACDDEHEEVCFGSVSLPFITAF